MACTSDCVPWIKANHFICSYGDHYSLLVIVFCQSQTVHEVRVGMKKEVKSTM